MRKTAQGFTLVELLIVIAIIAILAAVVLVIVNPVELTRKSRDATRLSDLSNLQKVIDVALQSGAPNCITLDAVPCLYATANTSVNSTAAVIPATNSLRSNDGNGWVRIALNGLGVSVPTLPVDPQNGSACGSNTCAYYYIGSHTSANTYVLGATLESNSYASKMTSDGGIDNTHYERGTDLTLTP